MCLEGGQDNERGYAMAALLVSLAVMMVLMSVAMPVWKTQAQREKEAELIFRGEQIARGINLYMRKMGGASYPPSLDVLVQGRFLRKKYKDPMTENDTSLPMNQRGEWDIVNAAGGVPGQGGASPQQPGGRGRGGAPATGLSAPPSPRPGVGSPTGSPGPSLGGQTAVGGMMGVRSKSKESSFKIYKGTGTHYNEWLFLFSTVSNRPGAPGGGQPVPGMPGRGGPGQRGAPVPGMGPGMGPGRGINIGPDGGRGPRGFGPGPVQPGVQRGRGQ
jgi:type II secretory pathway pseudopilin PulG